jgi:hypothetical protein
MRVIRFVIALAVAGFFARPSPAERVTVDRPVQISTVKADKKPLSGKLVAYDEEGFELARGKDKTVKVRWSELAAPGVYNVMSTIVGPRAGGEDWIWVGRTLLKVDGGAPFAERAFARALKLDPKLRGAIDAAQQSAAEQSAAQPEPVADGTPDADEPAAPPAGAKEAGDGTAMGSGPQVIGKSDGKAWPPMTEEQRAAAVAELKKFAEGAGRKLDKPLALRETKYFLFYSDLAPQDAVKWAGLLDRMYARLAELFAVQREPASPGAGRGGYVNVWHGKALVFVFQNPDDYRRFQAVVHQTDAGSSAGMCHCFGDGRVHIAFYRQAEENTFAHVLVHESVHGFIHRFRSPALVPSWANEGLAEVISSELVPRPGRDKQREFLAKSGLQSRAGVGGMMDAKHIDGWQYPVAETLCAFMVRQNKRHYVDFIIGIKDGLTWEQSLEQRYQAPRDRLVRAYRESLGLKN